MEVDTHFHNRISWETISFGVKVEENVEAVLCKEITDGQSFVSILIALLQRDDLKDRHKSIDSLLETIGKKYAKCQQIIEKQLPDRNKVDKQSARDRAKARIMAQFAKQQAAFQAKMSASDSWDSDSKDDGGKELERKEKSGRLYKDYEHAECVLCKERKDWKENPLGLIGRSKRSLIVKIMRTKYRKVIREAIGQEGYHEQYDEIKDEEAVKTVSSSPINERNEKAAIQLFAKKCKDLVTTYPTTYEEDKQVLITTTSWHQKLGIWLRMSDKEILQQIIKYGNTEEEKKQIDGTSKQDKV